MDAFKVITSNYLINVAFLSWAAAQILKTLFTLIAEKRFVAERLFGAGGMPSAHSALVVSLTVAVARKEGFSSPLFALALCFAGIVMYDAMGVRRAAGEQAKVLNSMVSSLFQKRHQFGDFPKLDEYFSKLGKRRQAPVPDSQEGEEKAGEDKMLNEFLGHTPLEVIGGALLGILMAMVIPVS